MRSWKPCEDPGGGHSECRDAEEHLPRDSEIQREVDSEKANGRE